MSFLPSPRTFQTATQLSTTFVLQETPSHIYVWGTDVVMIQDEKSRLENCGHVPGSFLTSEAIYRTKSPKILQRKGCEIGKVLVYTHCVQQTWAFEGSW